MSHELLAMCTRLPGNDLVGAECLSLTGGAPNERGIAPCRAIELVEQAAYVNHGVRSVAFGRSLDELAHVVEGMDVDADQFRIDCGKLPSSMNVTRRDVILRVADALTEAGPNLDSPRHRFLVTADENGVRFSEVLTSSTHSYCRHDEKPYTTSSALPTRLARALVNLVAPRAESLLDPCCGTGSILFEACAVGMHPRGSDWNPRMVGMSRKNAAHFGYAVPVELGDAVDPKSRTDAVVTNLPYGRNLRMDPDSTRRIFENLANVAPIGVFVAAEDLTSWLLAAGYRDVEVLRVPKTSGFVRFVHHALVRA